MKNKRNPLEVALNHYFQVLRGEEFSNSKKISSIPLRKRKSLAHATKPNSLTAARKPENLKEIWKEHEEVRRNYLDLVQFSPETAQEKPSFSYLDLKIEIAEKLFNNCIFCRRRCGIDRHQDQGFCGVQDAKIASEFLHMGEETPLVPSHTIFFTGCSFKCVYCQNWDISQHPEHGMSLSEQRLAEIIDRRTSEGSRNVNFVGGDPTPQLLYILGTIRLIKANIPVIWNSNLYMSPEAMKLLDGVVDLYLTDFKYGNDDCALRLSEAPDYWEVVTRNHKLARESGDMIIRHLVLPNHLECCTKPILDWIYHNLGKEAVLNIMGQYRPVYGACAYDDISRSLKSQELAEAVHYAQNLGFINLI